MHGCNVSLLPSTTHEILSKASSITDIVVLLIWSVSSFFSQPDMVRLTMLKIPDSVDKRQIDKKSEAKDKRDTRLSLEKALKDKTTNFR